MVYSAFLPETPENVGYAQVQGICLRRGRYPPSQQFGVAPMAKPTGSGNAQSGGPERPSPSAVVPGWASDVLDTISSDDAELLFGQAELSPAQS